MTHTLTKIGQTFLLKQGERKVLSTADAFMIVKNIKMYNMDVEGTDCLPEYYKSMLPQLITI